MTDTAQPHRPVDLASIRRAFIHARRAYAEAAGRETDPALVAHVPLPCGKSAVLDRADHDRIAAAFGGSFPACELRDHGHGHVHVHVHLPASIGGSPYHRASLARLILGGASSGRRVRHRDGNPLNLCRVNLYTVHGRAWGREADALARAVAATQGNA